MGNGRSTALTSPPAAKRELGWRFNAPSTAGAASVVAVALLAGALVGWFVWRVGGLGSTALQAVLVGACAAGAGVAVSVAGLRLLGATREEPSEELLQAASPAHPLMRRLLTEAPGTYVHSAAVANLAESGAEAVGADPLLARVGAYYHDVGKLSEPCFYFENQEEDANPHEVAHPAKSAEIIMSHVTEGVIVGREYGLPESVVEIIQDHHGTSLVRYFYHRAALEDASTYESDFRYRGQVPRSKEAAIVMLADASEASVRAMAFPEADRIEESVRAVMAERRADHQLDECGLSEADMEQLVGVFVKQLRSFRHVRCAYPTYDSKGAPSCRSAS